MAYVIEYRQTPYGDRYKMKLGTESDGSWTAYCLKHPHNPYSEDVSKCHLYPNGLVCVAAGREPESLDELKAIVAFWIDGYSEYIRTGVFPTKSRTYNV